jgi:hypothetical protein
MFMPVHHVRRIALAALAACALVLAACGGEDDQAFIDASKKVTTEISDIGEDIGTTVSGAASQDDAELERQFTELADRAGKAVDDLDALDPPSEDTETTVNDLSSALTKGQKDLESIAAAAGDSDAAAARSATEELVKDSPAISAGNKKLKEQTEELESES